MKFTNFLLFLVFFNSFGQRIELFADLEKNEIDTELDFLTSFNGNIYFYEQTNGKNKFIFKSNGTESGTEVLKDISNNSSSCTGIYAGTTKLIFGSIENSTYNLYISDGTSNGTSLIQTNNSGKYSNFIEINGIFYFTVGNYDYSNSLWKTDGTNAGTVLVKNDVNGSNFYNFNNTLYFAGFSSGTGQELWKSDGTTTGTNIISDRLVGNDSGIFSNSKILKYQNDIYFISGRYIVKMDLATEVYSQILDLNLSNSSSIKATDIIINNNDLFIITEGLNYGSIYKFNFISNVLTLLTPNSYNKLTGLTVFNNNVYCNNEYFLIKSDGTVNGTGSIIPFPNSSEYLFYKGGKVFNSNLFFLKYKIIAGKYYYSLWKTNGTTLGTTLVKEFGNGIRDYYTYPYKFEENQGNLYFYINDGFNGREIHKTDGTTNGTKIIKNIGTPNITHGINQFNIEEFNGKFLIYGSGNPYKLDTNSKTITLVSSANYTVVPFAFNNKVYLNSRQRVNSDLTGLDDFCPDCNYTPILFQNKIFLNRSSGFGYELYSYDGTTFSLIKDINPTSSSDPKPLGVINNKLIFTAYHPNNGTELWLTDGTSTGTTIIKDIVNGTGSIDVRKSFVYGNLLLFEMFNVNRYELWRTDGSEIGTYCISTNLTSSTSTYSNFIIYNNKCYFTADLSTRKLCVTDGTLAQTQIINGDYVYINAAPYFSISNNKLFFIGRHSSFGDIIYSFQNDIMTIVSNPLNTYSNRINAQTLIAYDDRQLVFSMDDFSFNSNFSLLDSRNGKATFYKTIGYFLTNFYKKINNLVFFAIDDKVHGQEFWVFRFPKCPNELNITDNYIDSNTKISANYKVEANNNISGGSLIYRSGEIILLSPGFKVESGGVFKTEIGRCENY